MKNLSGSVDYSGIMSSNFSAVEKTSGKKVVLDEKEVKKLQKEIAKGINGIFETTKKLYEINPSKDHHDLMVDLSQTLRTVNKLN